MADLTPNDLLEQIVIACERSSIVAGYTVHTLDLDILKMRVYLVDGSFIEVFYNAATHKTAFALIAGRQRMYGKDNAKSGWHVHPPDNPQVHRPCDPVSFETFLNEIDSLRFHPGHV